MHQNAIYIWFLDVVKFTDFRWKNAYVNRTQGMCHVTYIFWTFFNCAKFHDCRICVTDFRKGRPFCRPIRKQPRKTPSWIGLMFFWFSQYKVNKINCHKKNGSLSKVYILHIGNDSLSPVLTLTFAYCLDKCEITLEKIRLYTYTGVHRVFPYVL